MIRELLAHRRSPRTAFVIGGGGSLGAVQVGMLDALLERGIIPDLVVGCSVGALNGAAVAGRPSAEGVHRLRELWSGLSSREIFPPGRLRGPWRLARRTESMYPNSGLRRVIERWLPYRQFEEAAIPLHIVATSLHTGRERWFSSGPVVQALLASAALPAVFPPVWIGAEPYIDGGVVDNVPVSKAIELGARRVFVLHTGNFERHRPMPRRPLDVLVQAFSIARAHRFRMEQEVVPPGVELVTLPGVDPGPTRYNDLSRSCDLMDRAYQATATFLDRGVWGVERASARSPQATATHGRPNSARASGNPPSQ